MVAQAINEGWHQTAETLAAALGSSDTHALLRKYPGAVLAGVCSGPSLTPCRARLAAPVLCFSPPISRPQRPPPNLDFQPVTFRGSPGYAL